MFLNLHLLELRAFSDCMLIEDPKPFVMFANAMSKNRQNHSYFSLTVPTLKTLAPVAELSTDK